MKKYFIFALAALAAAFVLPSCSKSESPVPARGSKVNFVASVNDYSFTRATETSLETGDKIRIIAGAPINASATATVTDTGLELSSPIYWNKDQTEKTGFVAIYPDEDQTSPVVDDYDLYYGGSHDYEYHNLYMSATKQDVTPGTTVDLTFRHPFSKIVVNVTNNLEDEEVTGVSVNGVKMNGKLDLSAATVDLSNASDKDVPATRTGEGSYALIVMPQTATPSIVVTTDKASYKFVLSSAFQFKAGAAATAALTLNPTTTPITTGEAVVFSFAVTGWENGGTLDYAVYEPKWIVFGSYDGEAWSEIVAMTQTTAGTEPYEGVWEADINYAKGFLFKLSYDNWAKEAGMDKDWKYFGVGQDNLGLLGNSSENADIVLGTGYDEETDTVTCPEAGSYHLSFTYDGYILKVTKNE